MKDSKFCLNLFFQNMMFHQTITHSDHWVNPKKRDSMNQTKTCYGIANLKKKSFKDQTPTLVPSLFLNMFNVYCVEVNDTYKHMFNTWKKWSATYMPRLISMIQNMPLARFCGFRFSSSLLTSNCGVMSEKNTSTVTMFTEYWRKERIDCLNKSNHYWQMITNISIQFHWPLRYNKIPYNCEELPKQMQSNIKHPNSSYEE